MTEAELGDKVREEHPFVFRNNRGAAKVGKGYVRFGIPQPTSHGKEPDDYPKGGDFIGWTDIVVTPDMVGKTVAIFTNIEIKTIMDGPSKREKGQNKFHNIVLEHGGISEKWRERVDGEIEIQNEIIL